MEYQYICLYVFGNFAIFITNFTSTWIILFFFEVVFFPFKINLICAICNEKEGFCFFL